MVTAACVLCGYVRMAARITSTGNMIMPHSLARAADCIGYGRYTNLSEEVDASDHEGSLGEHEPGLALLQLVGQLVILNPQQSNEHSNGR